MRGKKNVSRELWEKGIGRFFLSSKRNAYCTSLKTFLQILKTFLQFYYHFGTHE